MVEIINPGSPSDKQSIPLATRRGRHIPNEQRMESSPSQLKKAQDYMLRKHPRMEPRSLSRIFNCMGHVFACRRTCIEPEYFIKPIAEDDGYRPLRKAEIPVPGDIAVYFGHRSKQVEHVGVIIQVNRNIMDAEVSTKILSQFGYDGEYFHDDNDYPEFLSVSVGPLTLTIWTERL